MNTLNGCNGTAKFQHSGFKNPCPVCGRTKDGDCRTTSDNRVFCHSHQHDKVGSTRQGTDGQEWAYLGYSSGGAGWGIYKIHQPLGAKSSDLSKHLERWQKPKRPQGVKYFDYPGRDGKPLVRVKRIDKGDGSKDCILQRWDGHGWVNGLDGVERELITIYRYKQIQAAIAEGFPIFWVEGETTADALWALGIPATTSIAGCKAFAKYGSYHKDLGDTFPVICPDRDIAGMGYASEVAEAFAGATQWLYVQPDSSEWSDLPDKGGYDLADWVQDLRNQGLEDSAIKAKILEAIGDRRDSLMSGAPDVSAVPKSTEEKGDFLEQAVNDLYSEGHYICLNQRDLYQWVETHYDLVADDRELKRITDYCRGRKFTPTAIKSVLELQKLATGITADEVNPPGHFNCTNGVLHWWWEADNLQTELLPHSPDLIFIDPPAVTYDPDADDTQLTRLLECLEPTAREILVRTLACSLDLPAVRKRKARTPRACLLYGTGANGKDAIRTAVFRLFGGRGCTAVGLNDFQSYDAGRKFGLADLEHSRVNWPSETVPAGKLDRIESLKLVVTGDPISIERKGIQERRLTPQTVLLFNCNQPPTITAATEAIKSRYAIIPFGRTYKVNPDPAKGELLADPRFKDDPQFIDRHILPALLNLLVLKLQQVAVEGIDYAPVADQIDEIRRRSSHLIQFCEDVGLVEDPDGMVSVNELWERLSAWYQQENYLTVETGNRGGKRNQWEHPPNDKCVTASHQVLTRFTELFPKIRRVSVRYTDPVTEKDVKQTGLKGINFSAEFPKIGFQGFQSTANGEKNPQPEGGTAMEPYPTNRVPVGFQEPSVGFQNLEEQNPVGFSETGSPGSPCTNDIAGNPGIESQKSGDPSQTHRVTGESPGVTAGSPPMEGRKPLEPYRNPNGTLLSGEGSRLETPTNRELNTDNAVPRKPWNPKSQNPHQQNNGEVQEWTDF